MYCWQFLKLYFDLIFDSFLEWVFPHYSLFSHFLFLWNPCSQLDPQWWHHWIIWDYLLKQSLRVSGSPGWGGSHSTCLCPRWLLQSCDLCPLLLGVMTAMSYLPSASPCSYTLPGVFGGCHCAVLTSMVNYSHYTVTRHCRTYFSWWLSVNHVMNSLLLCPACFRPLGTTTLLCAPVT